MKRISRFINGIFGIPEITRTKVASIFGFLTYELEERYNEFNVNILASRIEGTTIYGYVKGVGPVALIGLNPNKVEEVIENGFYPILEYGKSYSIGSSKKYHFSRVYDTFEAEKVSNYRVFGQLGFETIKEYATIKSVCYGVDTRFCAKYCNKRRLLNADAKIADSFIVEQVMLMINDEDFFDFKPVRFIRVNKRLIAMVGVYQSQVEYFTKFRDVRISESDGDQIYDFEWVLDPSEIDKFEKCEVYFYDIPVYKSYSKMIYDISISKGNGLKEDTSLFVD